MTADPRYRDAEYQKRTRALREATKASGGVCVFCRRPFDWSLPANSPGGFTSEHVVPLASGGHILGELAPAHRGCNSSDGRRRLTEKRRLMKDRHKEKHPGLK